jgi:hypothetical protein
MAVGVKFRHSSKSHLILLESSLYTRPIHLEEAWSYEKDKTFYWDSIDKIVSFGRGSSVIYHIEDNIFNVCNDKVPWVNSNVTNVIDQFKVGLKSFDEIEFCNYTTTGKAEKELCYKWSDNMDNEQAAKISKKFKDCSSKCPDVHIFTKHVTFDNKHTNNTKNLYTSIKSIAKLV